MTAIGIQSTYFAFATPLVRFLFIILIRFLRGKTLKLFEIVATFFL